MRRNDGSCLKNHHRHIDWEQTQQTYRDAAEQGYTTALSGSSKKKEGLAVTNPFAVDCRAYANGVYKKEAGGDMLDGLKKSKTENSFLGCKRACDFKDAAKNSNNKATSNLVDSFDASVFPEYFCRCGEVWVSGKSSGGKCVAPDPALHVSPPGYFGTTEALGAVTKNTFEKFERRSKLKDDKVKRELMEKAEREEKKRLKEEAEKQAAKKKKKKTKKKTKKASKKKTPKKKTTKKKAGSRL